MSDVMKGLGQFINGTWTVSHGAPALFSYDPATNALIWHGQMATQETLHSAFHCAEKARPAWANLDFSKRCAIVQAFAAEIAAKKIPFANLIALETGKPLWEAQTEVASVIAKVQLSIAAYQERMAPKMTRLSDCCAQIRYKPHGIVAVLGPFNFPAHLSNGHIVPALLAGNTVIFKPSELTPAVAEFMMDCWDKAHLPPGVLQCCQGDGETGAALLQLPLQGVFFTGSYQTGLRIHQQFSARPTVLLALEMGGNNPLVLSSCTDLKTAVYTSLLSCFLTTGQRCTAARRLIIPNNRFGQDFLDAFVDAASHLRIGAYTDTMEPFMGPVISVAAASAHLQAQERLIEAGAKPIMPMRSLYQNTGFLSPGILDCTLASQIPDEEIFAPLVQIYRYETFSQALALANQTQYGLCASLLSTNPEEYEQFYHHVNAGIINWNNPTTGAVSSLPFGGIGHSGNHRPSGYFTADYCAYPIASLERNALIMPAQALPGTIDNA